MRNVRSYPPRRLRSTLSSLALLFLLLLAASRTASGYEVRFNCGGGPYIDSRGHSFDADVEYTPQNGAGYVGGWVPVNPTWRPVGGTPDETLYITVRNQWDEYRFDVAPGDYLVRMRFADITGHGPDLRIFDVAIEGQLVLDDFDIYALVGDHYAIDCTYHVDVTDGQLNVIATLVDELIQLNAIEVWDVVPDTVGPPVPTGFTIWESYGRIMFDWDDNYAEEDLAGYHLERSLAAAGPFERISTDLIRRSRAEDATASPATTYYYRILAEDAFGNEGDPTDPPVPGSIRPDEMTRLPIYEITIDPDTLRTLNSNPHTDEEVRADFGWAASPESPWMNVGVRYRGRTSRSLSKKSWKVNFDKFVPGQFFVDDQERINLNSHFGERTGIREKLAWELCRMTGIPWVHSQHIQLRVNGEYFGVYTEDEQVDERWLDLHGYPAGGSLYKAEALDACLDVLPDSLEYTLRYGKKTNETSGYDDLIQFIELINATPPEEIWNRLAPIFDLEGFINFKAVMTALGNDSFFCHNYYLYHDLVADYWYYIPWDLDSTFGHLGVFEEEMREDVYVLHGFRNPLIGRLQDVPHFRRRVFERTLEILSEELTSQSFDPTIDSTFALVHEDLRLDWRKWGWEDPQWVDGGAALVKSFIPLRQSYVSSRIPIYMPQQDLFVNEIMADNDGVIQDEAGDYDDWVELINVGTEPMDLAGHFLTDDIALPRRWEIPDTTLGPGEYMIFWCDNEESEGPTHTNFKLEKQGEWVGIYGPLASFNPPVESKGFGPQIKDVSYGRFPDGHHNWTLMGTPTPGAANLDQGNLPPVITDTAHFPATPGLNVAVTVTARIEDDDGIDSASVFYNPDAVFVQLPMVDDGTNGDVEAGDGIFTGIIPGQPVGGPVQYYIYARDTLGRSYTDPRDAPIETHTYTVDFVPPELFVNEFLAQNLTVLRDEFNEYDDWLEIYNGGQAPISLLGLRLSDDLSDPDQFIFPDTTLVPGGFLLVWCDNDSWQGDLHANFRLSTDGEEIGLFADARAGFAIIDSVTFGPQAPDISQGRDPDGGPDWRFFTIPTPNASNQTIGIDDDERAGAVPLRLVLGPGRPNPTFGRAIIPFGLPARGRASLVIYNLAGRVVARVLDEVLEPGFHQAEWDGRLETSVGAPGRPAAAGVYFYRLRWAGDSRTGKLALVR